MKYPLQPRPFPPLRLTPEQCIEYETTAMAVLEETLDEYHTFVHKQQRKINKKRWKAVKTRENVTVYKKKDREDIIALQTSGSSNSGSSGGRAKSISSDSWSSHSSGADSASVSAIKEWSLPKLLGVGTIVGTLEDIMYGNMSPTNDCFKIKTTYVEDELVDSEVLYTFRSPTHEDPFQFLGLKWFIKGHPTGVNTVVKPRDMVYIEATGLHMDPTNGETLGYHVMHSVEVTECPILKSLGILRASFSSGYIFGQLGNGAVEIYMKTFMEPAGTLPDKIAIMTSANGLIACWKTVWCSQNKKLAWLLKDAVAQRSHKGDDGSVKVKTNAKSKQCCSLCAHSFSTFRRAIVCELCRAVVCNKCRTVRKPTYMHQKDLVRIPAVFCKTCITVASNTSAMEIARHEYVYGESLTWWGSALSHAVTESMDGTIGEYAASAWDMESIAEVDTIDDWDAQHRMHSEFTRPSVSVLSEMTDADYQDDDDVDSLAIVPRYGASSMQPYRPLGYPPAPAQLQQQQRAPPQLPYHQLWVQMNQLRLQAEQAYETTRSNTRAMMDSNRAPHHGSFGARPF